MRSIRLNEMCRSFLFTTGPVIEWYFLLNEQECYFLDWLGQDWLQTGFLKIPIPFIWMGWGKSKIQSRSCLPLWRQVPRLTYGEKKTCPGTNGLAYFSSASATKERVSMRLTPGVGRRSISGCYCYWRSSDFRRWSETTSRIQRILYHLARSSPSTTSTPSSALSRLFRFRPSAVKFIKLFFPRRWQQNELKCFPGLVFPAYWRGDLCMVDFLIEMTCFMIK